MQFLQDLAAQTADKFKDTAEAVWDALGPTTRGSGKLRESQRTAGKYALTASLGMMLNYPDNAEVFRDTFNLTGPGHTGAGNFLDDDELAGIGRILGRSANVSMVNNQQAQMVMGYADVTATSSLSDIQKMLPMLVAVTDLKGSK